MDQQELPDYYKGILGKAKQHWFLVGVAVTFLLAALFPSLGSPDGYLPAERARFYALVFISFVNGISVYSKKFQAGVMNIKLHVCAQIYSMMLIPLLIRGFTLLLSLTGVANQWILHGVAVTGIMPPPLLTPPVFTKGVKGNESAAILNVVLGNLIAIIATPITMMLLLGKITTVPLMSTVKTIVTGVLLPAALGNLVRIILYLKTNPYRPDLITQAVLLFTLYFDFCEAVRSSASLATAMYLLPTAAFVTGLHIGLCAIVFSTASKISSLSTPDVFTITFCSTHKSLTIGTGVINNIYADNPSVALIQLPLLLYSVVQLIVGGSMVGNSKTSDFARRATTATS